MKIKLSWNYHLDHLNDMLHELLKSKYLADVTLVCDDGNQIDAHKVLLSACSTVLKDKISQLPETESVIRLTGISSSDLKPIFEFMYLGKATIDQDVTGRVLSVARKLKVKEMNTKLESEDRKIASVSKHKVAKYYC